MKEDKEVCSECGGELGTEHCLDCGYAGDCTDPEYLFKQKPTTEETKNKMSKSQKIARAKSIDAELEYNKLNPSAFKLVITLKTEKGKQYLEETQAFLNHKIFKTITELINTNNLSLRGFPDFWN